MNFRKRLAFQLQPSIHTENPNDPTIVGCEGEEDFIKLCRTPSGG
jgi:hypothetical protein